MVDAIVVNAPINGVVFASEMGDKPTTQPMACEFVRTLFRFAEVLKSKGIHKVGTLGSYCYRCCCAWSETNFCRGVNDPEPSCGSNGDARQECQELWPGRWVQRDEYCRTDLECGDSFTCVATETRGAHCERPPLLPRLGPG